MDIAEYLSGYRLIDAPPKAEGRTIDGELEAAEGIAFSKYRVDESKFAAYCAEVAYERRFAKYHRQYGAEPTWTRKRLEHFVSFEFTTPQREGLYLDVAASSSPVYKIIPSRFGARKSYRQDLNFKRGVRWRTIGSDASQIPLPDGCADAIYAHNSWEHFEGDSDVLFLREAARLLKPGGRLVIIPLNVGVEGFQLTSPAVWSMKYRNAPEPPEFDKTLPILIRESTKQRLIKMHSVATLVDAVSTVPELVVTVYAVENHRDFDFQRHFLVGERVDS